MKNSYFKNEVIINLYMYVYKVYLYYFIIGVNIFQ